MTVFQLFKETLKLIIRGKGKYCCRLLIDGIEHDIKGLFTEYYNDDSLKVEIIIDIEVGETEC